MKTKVIIKEQKTYNLPEIEIAIGEIFREFDLFEKLKDKKNILLKPNLLGAHHPDKAVTTHPLILEAVIHILKDQNKEIIVGDSPGGTVKSSIVWEKTGVQEVCEKYKARLIDFGKEGVINIQTNVAKFYFDKHIMECDAIINLAKMKTHSLMLYTGAIKNLYGAIPGLYKSDLHKEFPSPKDFSSILSSIYGIIKPNIAINIIDGIIGMDGEGPSAGKPYPYGVIIASDKASAADYIATQMMGFDLNNINYLKQSLFEDDLLENVATTSGINETIEIESKYKNFKYKDVKIKSVIFTNSLIDKIPKFIKSFFVSFLECYPAFKKECKLCLVCVQSCPVLALEKSENKLILNKKKCIKCLCCHELCPLSAIYLKRHFLGRVLIK